MIFVVLLAMEVGCGSYRIPLLGKPSIRRLHDIIACAYMHAQRNVIFLACRGNGNTRATMSCTLDPSTNCNSWISFSGLYRIMSCAPLLTKV